MQRWREVFLALEHLHARSILSSPASCAASGLKILFSKIGLRTAEEEVSDRSTKSQSVSKVTAMTKRASEHYKGTGT